MKKLLKTIVFIMIASFVITSCKKDLKESAQEVISEETLAKIHNHGFGTSNVQIIDEGYLVEGDIILTKEFLNSTPGGHFLRIAKEEQYRTTNLVTGLARVITVSSSGKLSTALDDAIDEAIARYNAESLLLTFSRIASGGDINIKIVNGGPYIASAGFPTSNGDPYGEVKFNRQYQNYSAGFLATVISHEMGHCIGFRHTDYMNRSFSCGGAASNEGASSVGAIHIDGTPTGPDEESWMLACLGALTNRPFNTNDKKALNVLY